MHQYEKTIISLDDCYELFSAFGISPYSKDLQRARREDGFRQVDLEGILQSESPLVVGMDWRGWLKEAVDEVLRQLATLDIAANAELDESGNQGVFRVNGKAKAIKYVLVDEDNFDDVVVAINLLIGSNAHYKKFRSCVGSDGWMYAVLKNDDWRALHTTIPKTFDLLFMDAFVS